MTTDTTQEVLQYRVQVLESKLLDAQVDRNMQKNRIEELERQLREAHHKIRELELGTQTMRTLAIAGEEESFNPRESGVFHKDAWKGVR